MMNTLVCLMNGDNNLSEMNLNVLNDLQQLDPVTESSDLQTRQLPERSWAGFPYFEKFTP